MKIEERIEKMKKVYRETSVSDDHMKKEWQLLESMLGSQQQSRMSPLIFRTFAFLGVILFFSVSIATLAQASNPGEFLYPVKAISQKVVKKVEKVVPVFISTMPQPIPTVSQKTKQPTATPSISDEDQGKASSNRGKVQGIKDEKGENKKSNTVPGRTSKKETGTKTNDANRNSGFDNNSGNNGSKHGEKENPSSSAVEKNNSENQQEKSNGNASKK